MESLNHVHVLLVAVIAGTLWPVARILDRAGFNRAWCLLIFIPLLNWIALWVFAFANWPALENRAVGHTQAR